MIHALALPQLAVTDDPLPQTQMSASYSGAYLALYSEHTTP
jgi:hypothetical protein